MALDSGYDALWTVEADMIVPPDALRRLAAVDADVAYGLYVSRHGRLQWLAYLSVTEHSGTSISVLPERAREAWGKVIETQGAGMGCTLIHRHVLEAIPFRRISGTQLANDWYFSLDCIAHGFRQAHDMGCVCGHIQGLPSPKIYWPDPDDERLIRVEFLAEAMPERVQPGERMEVSVGQRRTAIFRAPEGEG